MRSGPDYFPTTAWTVVVAAGDEASPQGDEALERLCHTYWHPLYSHIRRSGSSAEDAQDLTQGFFARLLEKQYLCLADKGRGKFRTFLLSALKNFLINQHRKARAGKRGGGKVHLPIRTGEGEERYMAELADHLTPEKLFEKDRAITVVEQAYQTVRKEYEQADTLSLFERLQDHLWRDSNALSYARIADEAGMSKPSVKVAAFRLRKKFAAAVRGIVAQTVTTAQEVESELRFLREAFR